MAKEDTFSAYSPDRCIGHGHLVDVALAAHRFLRANPNQSALILQDSNCQIIDLDLSGDEALLERKADHYPIGAQTATATNTDPIREKVSLLPRHWQWLAQQGVTLQPHCADLLMTRAETQDGKPTLPANTTGSLPIAFARPCAVIFRAMKKPYEPCTQVIVMGSKHIHQRGHGILPPEPAQLPNRFGLRIRRTERKPKPQQVSLLLGTVLVGRAGVGNRMVRQQLNITGL